MEQTDKATTQHYKEANPDEQNHHVPSNSFQAFLFDNINKMFFKIYVSIEHIGLPIQRKGVELCCPIW